MVDWVEGDKLSGLDGVGRARPITSLLLKIAAWLLLGSVVIVTIGPISLRPETVLPLKVERFLGFAVLTAAFAFAYPKNWRAVVVLLCVAAVSLEVFQLVAPGRDAGIADAGVKVLGAITGTTGALFGRWSGQRLSSRAQR
jgi:hypothetical protein